MISLGEVSISGLTSAYPLPVADPVPLCTRWSHISLSLEVILLYVILFYSDRGYVLIPRKL